jgi:putative SOS response-associated peptidase YedK
VLRADEHGAATLTLLRWGLIPFWAKDPKIGNRLINARAETLADKPSFKHAFKRRRCLVLASGFYEWRPSPQGKLPVYISNPSGQIYAFAGLWERARHVEARPLETCVIVTVPANAALGAIHERMPAVLDTDARSAWLDADTPEATCQALLQPAPVATTQFWQVSRQVNDPTHEGEHLLSPATS